MNNKIIIARWTKDGYGNKTNEIYKKLLEIENFCKDNNFNPPFLEHDINSYGEEYKIYVDEEISNLTEYFCEDDFELFGDNFEDDILGCE